MIDNSRPSIQIDLSEFKLHLHLNDRTRRTFHFDSPSRRFYLSVIALVVNEMKKFGKIVRPYVGVRYIMINEQIKQANQLAVDYGALITRGEARADLAVMPGSPADKAGLQENDIILELNGQKIDQDHSLARLIAQRSPGDEVTLKVLSKGQEKEVKVKLEEYKESQ